MKITTKIAINGLMGTILLLSSQVLAQEELIEITEKLKIVGPDLTSEDFEEKTRKHCLGGYDLVNRVIDKKRVRSHIRCKKVNLASSSNGTITPAEPAEPAEPAKSEVQSRNKNPEVDTPRITFAKLRFSVGMLPACSGEHLEKGHLYCGEKYSAGFAVGDNFATVIKLNHYSLHRAAKSPEIDGNSVKWRKDEMFATSAIVAQQKELLGIRFGAGLGYFGGILNQRQWIEYPFPNSDATISKERGYAWGMAAEVTIEKTFVDSAIGDFNVGLSTNGLFPSSTSNPRVEAKYWILPSLELTWLIGIKKRQSPT